MHAPIQVDKIHSSTPWNNDVELDEQNRPIDQFSSRCERSVALCTKDINKPVVPSCKLHTSFNSYIRFALVIPSFFLPFSHSAYRVGELPKYLKEMKIKEAEKNRLDAMIDINCPPGHIVLSEEERLESLNIAQRSKNSFFHTFFFLE